MRPPPDQPHAWLNCIGFEAVPVGDAPILIGRSKEASFVLPHETVSRRHAVIAVHKGKFRLKTLSPFGVVFNNEEVEGVVDVSVGDVFQIGPFVIQVDAAPGRDDEDATLPYGRPSPRRKPKPDADTRPAPRPSGPRRPTGRPPPGPKPPRPTRRQPPPPPQRPRP